MDQIWWMIPFYQIHSSALIQYADTNVQIDASAHQLEYDLRHSILFVQHIILLF